MKAWTRFNPVWMATIAGLLLATVSGYLLLRERQAAIDNAELQTANIASVLDEHARQTMLRVDTTLQRAHALLATTPSPSARELAATRAALRNLLLADELIAQIVLLDRQGDVLLSTLEPPPQTEPSHSSRDYFLQHRRKTGGTLALGAPLRDTAQTGWLLPVSLRLSTPGGDFNGALVALVRSAYFQTFYNAINRGPNGFVTLFSRDGSAIVTVPHADAVIAKNWAQSPLFLEHLPKADADTVRQVVVRDGTERIYSYRTLRDYPLVVSYGLSVPAILGAWRATVWRDAFLLLVTITLLGLAGLRLMREQATKQRAMSALQDSEERYRTAFITSPDAVNITRLSDGMYLDVNDGFVKIMGYTREETVGKTSVEMHIWHKLEDRDRLVHSIRASGYCDNLEADFVAKDGRVLHGLMSAHAITLQGERCLLSVTRDITARKLAEEQVRKLSLAVEQSSESIIITNLQGQIEYANEAFVRNSGYPMDDVIGHSPRLLQSGKTPRATYAALWEAIGRGETWRGEFINRRKDGGEYIEQSVISPIRKPDGAVTHYVAVQTDITAKRQAQDQINNLAFFEPLTGLPNRRMLLERLRHAVAASVRNAQFGALLFIDLDDFKTLNDSLGHDMGDLLLQQVGQRLHGCVRDCDTVARLGGDEFVVLLEYLGDNAREATASAEAAGRKILARLNQAYQLDDFVHHNTPSIGIALFSSHQGPIEELLKRADLAMYQAKDSGRNTLRFFEPGMQVLVSARAALESGLREAVEQRQFVLHYQVQVNGQGAVTGAEALLRWQHPQRGLIMPGEFISLAEDIGLIVPMGQWVLQQACEQLARWARNPGTARLSLSVNVSARQFYSPDFVHQLVQLLERSEARPSLLKLELTESMLVTNIDDVVSKMTQLKAIGVGFALDDFGTGYSSLAYLKRLPLDQLKIDRSFVQNILSDPSDAAIAKMVIALADSLGFDVIAEGVETHAQRVFLSAQGCNAYQGYLFGRAVSMEDFERLQLTPAQRPH